MLKFFPQAIEDVTLPEHSVAANIGLALDQQLEHEQSLLELSEGRYVVHDRRGSTVLSQDDGLAAFPDASQQLAGLLLNSLRLMMDLLIAIK